MDTGDISAVQIAAGLFGSVSLGTTVFLLLQIVKGLVGDRINGRAAEGVVIGTSFVAVVLALLAIDTNWRARETIVSLIIGTLATTIIARGLYSQLFKIGVEGIPVSPSATVPASAVSDPTQPDPYDSAIAAGRTPIAAPRGMTDAERAAVSRERGA